VHDPWVDAAEAQTEYSITPIAEPERGTYDAVVLCVGHAQFKEMGAQAIRALCKDGGIFYDVKGLFDASESEERL
jgi:UDP-N-acetyl-D-galactosamine dehydrogenase